ncbi:MAG: hypothetical protein UR25_C0004G0102 [Candidatus Nomurabacteria bacterium GW2011_GWE1_32_28]|uniref:Uncharacterized protein n=1 Tax=Candidatus Nomurabacteria bacterium GW2011_GWF1_31_48 TaxID=1618767 RepID=A0A0G0BGP0_9BACT|nr:MAG: hypothetical protein UR10_C0004G0102 [Candidatus Nomurabacteria bacterium GW2011_GWF2_30_133]KKP28636.1 MAG: hypothetical protein UR18_C0002G0048 [Candidatus Nomurabacteria bacterium GW2011_GWE2_31_40]KKP30212.1 MAG: hypothetical protein UR19_C0003G0048 [Candidatus Nomurabacteria bacterium GW2011_GWF1_31_48]KKP34738.1 MAG: hypothetical protein UR25_C0004G0102 [Candidatus Nomurabacteria bacterium GW2011_GWE1_32_28]HAS80804.1 hypothetical protein [Candidatus Nomurabacteria bacterium]
MDNHYLPNFDKEKSKAYTPIGVRNLFQNAVDSENGNIEAVFKNKHKNKNLIELYHASFLALSIKKWLGKEYTLYPDDSPDVYFLDNKNNEAFPVEIMELYFHENNSSKIDYKKLAQHIFDKKGLINFPQCHLLIASRIVEKNFNISELYREIKKFSWYFERIWFSVYTENIQQWTFFEIYPAENFNEQSSINFNLTKDRDIFY